MFIDNMAIVKGSLHLEEAYQFIDFLLRDDVAAQNAIHVMYPTPNQAAKKLIPADAKGASFQLPENYHVLSIQSIGDSAGLYEKIWTEIKAS